MSDNKDVSGINDLMRFLSVALTVVFFDFFPAEEKKEEKKEESEESDEDMGFGLFD